MCGLPNGVRDEPRLADIVINVTGKIGEKSSCRAIRMNNGTKVKTVISLVRNIAPTKVNAKSICIKARLE